MFGIAFGSVFYVIFSLLCFVSRQSLGPEVVNYFMISGFFLSSFVGIIAEFGLRIAIGEEMKRVASTADGLLTFQSLSSQL